MRRNPSNTSEPKDLEIASAPSPNHDDRNGQAVDILLLHYTGMKSGAEALARLRDPAAKVSAHYLIEEDGRAFQLVPEARRAWHAGRSYWAGARDINARSVGIELVNPGHEFGYRPFPEAQMLKLIALCHGILARHAIPAARVIGHSDVAPDRKQDPGELFDWQRLAADGVGLWPGEVAPSEVTAPDQETAKSQLARFGYGLDAVPLELVVTAFQRHFRPGQVDGRLDGETAGRLSELLGYLDAGPQDA